MPTEDGGSACSARRYRTRRALTVDSAVEAGAVQAGEHVRDIAQAVGHAGNGPDLTLDGACGMLGFLAHALALDQQFSGERACRELGGLVTGEGAVGHQALRGDRGHVGAPVFSLHGLTVAEIGGSRGFSAERRLSVQRTLRARAGSWLTPLRK